MKPRSVIMWTLLPVLVVLAVLTSVQAQELREVPASDILKQIENGEDIFLENVRIIGDLDCSKIALETVPVARSEEEIKHYSLKEELKIVESEIKIRKSVFEDDVDFSNTQFRKEFDIRGTTILGKNNFRGADFNGDAVFWVADFNCHAYFLGANFNCHANFAYAFFSDNAYFDVAVFSDYASFEDAIFSGEADFERAVFSDYADFDDAVFSDYADFEGAVFSKAEFDDAVFSDYASFEDAIFSDYADFDDAYLGSSAEFNSTEFNKVSFTGTTFTTVSLNESEFNQMKVEWSSLKDTLVFNGPTYIKLIKNFREMEQFDDADDAYYQYRRLSQANKKWPFSKLGDVFMWVTCGYGVEPHYTIICGLVIILVFAFIYWRGGGIRQLKEIDGDGSRVSFWDALYFSMVTFTTVGYGDWYPVDRYRMAVMIE